MKGTVTIPGLGTITNLAFLARALETQVGANILSTPTLLTLDNEEARIIVGQNIPLVTGSYATTGNTTTVTPFQTFERKDVGLMLRVKPQITEGGTIRLVLYQEVSRIEDVSTQTGVILSKRALESTVVVDDTQIIVLGGLIEDRLTDGTDKVPGLGDIPIAGALFRYDARRRQKTNLMIFIKPTVLAHELRRTRHHVGALPVPDGRAGAADPGAPALLERPDAAHAPAPGRAARHARRRSDAAAARRQAAACAAPSPSDARPAGDGHRIPRTATGFAHRIPYAFARTHGVLAQGEEHGRVVVLMRPDATVEGIAELKRVLQRPLSTRAVDADRFATELARAYNVEGGVAQMSEDFVRETDLARLLQDLPPAEDLLDSGTQAPVIRMINALLLQALRERASDVHFEPYEARSVVRFRIDGVLRDVLEPPRALHAALVSRVKIMASLDIAEKRLPQDGRLALKLGDKQVDVRVSTLPTGPGERVVLRLLDKDSAQLDLTALGMSAATLAAVDRLIREPHGIVLVTGPTGSGKTTTLYAALSRLPRGTLNMMTVEDPIEYALDGVGQTQVNPKIELDFARALRAILRQDPDIIMIGEIRDLETAQIAVQASLTGHLVLATLHTNDAASAMTRLADMGVEPYLLASSLLGVLAQRLVRTLCPACRTRAAPTAGEAELLTGLGLPPDLPLHAPAGCAECRDTGYRGRSGVYELIVVDEALRRLIHDRAPEHTLRAAAAQAGTTSLRRDGARWLANGTTSLAEIVRVSREA